MSLSCSLSCIVCICPAIGECLVIVKSSQVLVCLYFVLHGLIQSALGFSLLSSPVDYHYIGVLRVTESTRKIFKLIFYIFLNNVKKNI